MTQEELASRIGTKQPAIARFESGHADPRLSTIKGIACALDATFRLDIAPREAFENGFKMTHWWLRPEQGAPWKKIHDQNFIAVSDCKIPFGVFHIFNFRGTDATAITKMVPVHAVEPSGTSFQRMIEAESSRNE